MFNKREDLSNETGASVERTVDKGNTRETIRTRPQRVSQSCTKDTALHSVGSRKSLKAFGARARCSC